MTKLEKVIIVHYNPISMAFPFISAYNEGKGLIIALCCLIAFSCPGVKPGSSGKGKKPIPSFSASFRFSGFALSSKNSSQWFAGKSGGVLSHRKFLELSILSYGVFSLYIQSLFESHALSLEIPRATRAKWC